MDKIAIVGAGFYGLMLGKMLSKKHKVDIFEEQNDIMTQASSQCQMRIHSGMMYPRDLKTAMMCVRTFKPFMLKFKDAIVDDFKSLYAVANDSKISSKEFFDAQKKLGLPIKKIKNEFFDNVQDVYECNEFTFDVDIIKKTLSDQNIILNTKIENINQLKHYDKIFICTYDKTNELLVNSHMNPIENLSVFNTEKLFVKDNLDNTAVCVVDGDYFTTMCLPDRYNGVKTLTASGLTSNVNTSQKDKVFERVKHFIPDINLTYVYSTFGKKAVVGNHRSCYININNNVYTIIGGKITNVFELFDKLRI